MEAMYELNARDVLVVLEQQLATTEFNGQCDYVPYAEFDCSGHCILLNLMSASWANHEAVKISLKDSYIYTYITGMIVGQDCYRCIHTWLNARTHGFRQ